MEVLISHRTSKFKEVELPLNTRNMQVIPNKDLYII
jgi:hypothetical protein